jgi:hypothetical protein
MGRRVFNRLVIEISLAVGHFISRYALWMYVHELDLDPEEMTAQDAAALCGVPLRRFLATQAIRLEPGELRRLESRIRKINPYRADPYDRVDGMERAPSYGRPSSRSNPVPGGPIHVRAERSRGPSQRGSR